jgi:hypothetical protein
MIRSNVATIKAVCRESMLLSSWLEEGIEEDDNMVAARTTFEGYGGPTEDGVSEQPALRRDHRVLLDVSSTLKYLGV